MTLPDDPNVRYFARLFMRTGTGSGGNGSGNAGHGRRPTGGVLPPSSLPRGSVSVGLVGHSLDFSPSSALDHTDRTSPPTLLCSVPTLCRLCAVSVCTVV